MPAALSGFGKNLRDTGGFFRYNSQLPKTRNV